MSRDKTVERHGHAAVVVRPAIEYVSGRVVGDTHERIVRCAIADRPRKQPLRHPVENMSRDHAYDCTGVIVAGADLDSGAQAGLWFPRDVNRRRRRKSVNRIWPVGRTSMLP